MTGILKLEEGKFETAEKNLNIAQNYIDTVRFVEIPLLSVTSHLAIAKVSTFQMSRNSELQELRIRQESYLKTLCSQSLSDSKPYPCFRTSAYRACAKYCVMTNKPKKADEYFREGILIASEFNCVNIFEAGIRFSRNYPHVIISHIIICLVPK